MAALAEEPSGRHPLEVEGQAVVIMRILWNLRRAALGETPGEATMAFRGLAEPRPRHPGVIARMGLRRPVPPLRRIRKFQEGTHA